MAHLCNGCGMGIDQPGRCHACRSKLFKALPWLKCVMCTAPFREGMPHKMCLARMGRRAAKGLGLPSWRKARSARGGR